MAIIPTPPPSTATTSAIPAGAPAQVQQLGEVVVEQVPERIAQLARTILLSGTITEQKPGGAMVLRTQVGELIIRSQTPLPLDKVLTLQIPPGAPPVRAQVTLAYPANAPATATGTPPTSAAVNAPLNTSVPNLPAGASGPLPVGVPLPQAAPAQTPARVPVPNTSAPGARVPGTTSVSAPLGTPLPTAPITAPLTPGTASPPAPNLAGPHLPAATLISAPMLAAAAQAVAATPVLPGTVLPAQVLALPDPTSNNSAPRSALPPALAPFTAVQQAGAPALQTLLPQGLSELLAKLPAAVLAPLSAPTSAAPPIAAPASVPAFASLPVLLTLPAGSQVTLQIERVAQTPATSLAAPTTTSTLGTAAPSFGAVVIGQTPQGEPLATSPAGLLVLPSKTPLAVGTMVELSLLHVAEPAAELPGDVPARLRDWPVLQQIQQVLGPAGAGPALRTARSDNLGGVAAFLAAALKLGEPQRIISQEASEVLRQRGHGELLTRLTGEVQQAGQSFLRQDAPATEWRSLALPLPLDSQMQRLALHIRREADPQAPAGAGPLGKRLVIEVELSRLGPLLLDGFIRPQRFDVLLRSQRRLPRTLQRELRLAYQDSLIALRWQGSLEFQTAAELWLRG